jgi:hypothetical protein
MEICSGGLAGDEAGVEDPQALSRSIDSQAALIDRRDSFFRHCFKHLDSADEESDRFGDGEMGGGKKGTSPGISPSAGVEEASSPAGSGAGGAIAQNRPERRPNGSPLITLRAVYLFVEKCPRSSFQFMKIEIPSVSIRKGHNGRQKS